MIYKLACLLFRFFDAACEWSYELMVRCDPNLPYQRIDDKKGGSDDEV